VNEESYAWLTKLQGRSEKRTGPKAHFPP